MTSAATWSSCAHAHGHNRRACTLRHRAATRDIPCVNGRRWMGCPRGDPLDGDAGPSPAAEHGLDDGRGDVTQLAVLALRGGDQGLERFLRRQPPTRHEDALGLFDDGT